MLWREIPIFIHHNEGYQPFQIRTARRPAQVLLGRVYSEQGPFRVMSV